MDSLTAHLVKHYRIEAEIGDCGLGRLFEAHSPALGSAVTILALADHGTDESFAARFEEQMRRVQGLHHRALMTLTHFARENGMFYVVMEHFPGRTMTSALAQEAAVRLRDAVAACQRVAEGLDFAHRNGLVHGALHLDTIMVADDWQSRVLGLGIAKAADPVSLSVSPNWPPVGYRPPEQRAGVPLDARADVYALGAVLYRLITGQAPAENAENVRARSLQADLPPALDEGVMRMLARKPRERPQTARECAAILARLSLAREVAEMVLPHGAPEPVAAQAAGDTPLRQGLALYQARQWEAAAAHLEEAVRSSPQGVRALAYLGAARYATSQYPEAVEAFRRASALQPRNARLHYDLASALLGAGELDEARREFEAARSLDPTYTAAGAAIAALNGMHVPG